MSMKSRAIKTLLLLAIGGVAGVLITNGGINAIENTWHNFFPEEVEAQVQEEKKVEPIKYHKVTVSEEDLGEIQQISLLFTYQQSYKDSERIDLVKLLYAGKTDDRNFAKKSYKTVINWFDKKWREKAIMFKVKSVILMGYYTDGFGMNDIKYNPGNKTLYIKSPQLQMAAIIDYSHTHMSEGIRTSMLDPIQVEEIDKYHNITQDRIIKKFSSSKHREAAYKLTNDDLKKKLIHNKNLSIDVEHVVFEENTEEINVLNDALKLDELADSNNVKNNNPMEVLKKQEEEAKKKDEETKK
ncbi:hypothetical protein O0Q50_20535 [Priestia aryabhattai]|uniref:Uncharacterized protein n=1 Tax=Priestia aryabhattai TaxID=412384 RepID=A0AAX6NCP7_PRIAR|nr:hypothetical protein [Priestia aryabhattai]MDU9693567.1 hypothetical protein [Priestia aryabhattai]